MDTKKLQIEQLERRIKLFAEAQRLSDLPIGWIKAIRLALGMTMQQLATKLSITSQSILELENREKEGTITLKTLREAAQAMEMDLVYGLVPKDGSLQNYIDKKARKLAEEIVNRTSTTMKLEDQENSQERIQKAIETRTENIKQNLPKALWD